MKFRDTEYGDLSGQVYSNKISCRDKQLTSLNGAPIEVGGYFDCNNNQLTSLKGAPKEVRGDFHCNNNQLTSLEGAPQKVGGYFVCSNNQLTSLEGALERVGGDFYCRTNDNLHSLLPLKLCRIGGTIVCDDRLQYQIPLLKSCETEDDFAVQAYLGTDDESIRKYFADNYDSVAVYVAIDEIF